MESTALRQTDIPGFKGKARALYIQASTLYTRAGDEGRSDLLDEAMTLAEKAHLSDPGNLQSCNLLARIQLRRGELDSAERWAGIGLGLKPDSTSILYTAGLIALEQHQLDQAEGYFARATRISRVATRAPVSLAHIHLLKGNFNEAFAEYRQLLQQHPDDVYLQSRLMEAAAGVRLDEYDAVLADELLQWFEFEGDISLLDRLTLGQLKLRYRAIQGERPLEITDLLDDPLLIAACSRFAMADPDLERLLTSARLSILTQTTRQLAIDNKLQPLALAIAKQTSLNEGSWMESDDEQQQIARLQTVGSKLLQLADAQSLAAASACCLLIAMYRPIQQTPLRPQLLPQRLQHPAFDQGVSQLLLQQLAEQEQRALHADVIPQLGYDSQMPHPSPDFKQSPIAQLYESNPYPRWQYLGNYPASDYMDMLQKQFPGKLSHLSPRSQLNVLVAGCGTGRQALRLARFFTDLHVTALDLSLASLSYGRSRQADFGLSVDWIQGDILDVAQLNQSFDAIECSGVLHHMNNPLTGLMALSSILKAGGVIKLALYSRTARRGIQTLRNNLDTPTINSANQLRQLRFGLKDMDIGQQAGLSDRQIQEIVHSRDFYSLSGTRDLLCNPTEHVFDISGIEDWLSRAGLKWVGMLASGQAVKLANEFFQQPAAELTPAQWQQIEKQHPQLFAGMYQFYATKPALADLR